MSLPDGKWSNWSGSVTCKPRETLTPRNEIDLAALVRSANGPVRAVGTGHAFAPLCASEGVLLNMTAFTGLKSTFQYPLSATIRAATPLWMIGPLLHSHGLALRNLGDSDRQTLAGVIATGSHGTGRTIGSLSSDVAGFRLILADGTVLNCNARENTQMFEAGRVALGTFGIMTEITLALRSRYRLTEDNFFLRSDDLFQSLDRLIFDNRHFGFFWFPYSEFVVCRVLAETDKAAPEPRSAEELRRQGIRFGAGASLFAGANRLLPNLPFLVGPAHGLFSRIMPRAASVRWSYEILPAPRPVRFNMMEYAVPLERGADCLREIAAEIRKKRINTGFPLEFRTVAADDIWLSPFYHRDSATIAVHQYYKSDPSALFGICEEIFRSFEGRPHWGTRHSCPPTELNRLYPEFERFCMLRRELDPGGKFLNAYLASIFG